MRIAHISDLHVLGDEPVAWWRYANKRATGLANLKLRRHAVHKRDIVQTLARELRERKIDHVVVTGDVSNLALETEFEAVRRLFEDDLGFSPDDVSIVPGNHDVYTSGAARKKRFSRTFAAYLSSDLPGVASDHPSGPFPYVRIRRDLAIIGLSTAIPRAPLLASGELGRAQLEALDRVLGDPEVKKRSIVVLQHHPPFNPPSRVKALTNGLSDARALREVLERVPHALVLHGHLHLRIHLRAERRHGVLESVGATSASLLDPREDRMAGINVYEIDDGTWSRPRALVLDHADRTFHDRSIPHRLVSAV